MYIGLKITKPTKWLAFWACLSPAHPNSYEKYFRKKVDPCKLQEDGQATCLANLLWPARILSSPLPTPSLAGQHLDWQ